MAGADPLGTGARGGVAPGIGGGRVFMGGTKVFMGGTALPGMVMNGAEPPMYGAGLPRMGPAPPKEQGQSPPIAGGMTGDPAEIPPAGPS